MPDKRFAWLHLTDLHNGLDGQRAQGGNIASISRRTEPAGCAAFSLPTSFALLPYGPFRVACVGQVKPAFLFWRPRVSVG